MKKLLNFIDHQKSPLINGVVFPDGVVQIVNIAVSWESPVNYIFTRGPITSLENLSKEKEIAWINCAILVNLVDESLGIDFLAGEADQGSDGFLAAIDHNDRKLLWLAFFDCSNPFNKLKN